MTATVTSRPAPHVGSWSRLLLARLSSLQLPWLRRWNLTGDIRRYHYLKLCLIGSSDIHLKLNGIRFSDPQYPARKYGFDDTVATIKNLNVCEFPAFRVHTDVGMTDGPGQFVLPFLQLYRLEDLAFEFCLPSANKWLQISVCVVGSSDLNGKPRYSETSRD